MLRVRQGVRTGLGHGGITCVLQTQFSSFILNPIALRKAKIVYKLSAIGLSLKFQARAYTKLTDINDVPSGEAQSP